jgi:hypothetical protein
LPDFTEYRLPEMDAAGIDVQLLSLTVPGLQAGTLVNDHLKGHYFDEPRYDEVWAVLEELSVPLYRWHALWRRLKVLRSQQRGGQRARGHTARIVRAKSHYRQRTEAAVRCPAPAMRARSRPELPAQ